jgi:hypothetical protein
MTVVTLQRRKPAPPPRVEPIETVEPTYSAVTMAHRSAADDAKRAVDALHRMTTQPFVTAASRAQAPRLIADAEKALAKLKDALG